MLSAHARAVTIIINYQRLSLPEDGCRSVQLDLVSAVRAGDGGSSTAITAAALPAEEKLAEVAYLQRLQESTL